MSDIISTARRERELAAGFLNINLLRRGACSQSPVILASVAGLPEGGFTVR